MGIFGGSVTFSRFYVRGKLPEHHREQYIKSIRLRAFEPLTVDSEDDESLGWCVPSDPLDLELIPQKLFLDDYIVLGLRTDKWRIPKSLFRAHFDEAAAAAMAKTGKEKLSKREKDDLKFRVNRKLRRKVIPSMRQFDLCWNTLTGTVLLWNRSARIKDDFSVLFEKTFKLPVEETSPFTEARRQLGEAADEALASVEQTSFLSVDK